MKVLAIHDSRGTIHQVVVVPADAPPGAVAAPAGYLVTEVDAPELHLDPAKPESLEKLVQTIRTQRVNMTGPGRLLRPQ